LATCIIPFSPLNLLNSLCSSTIDANRLINSSLFGTQHCSIEETLFTELQSVSEKTRFLMIAGHYERPSQQVTYTCIVN